jgi:S-(hydroxymethyl)glutathione dehydrogenase / alcohol dehydrogenase
LVRAAVLREPGTPLRIEDVVLPEPGPGQVRVRLAAAGVCHSDLSLARGTLRQPVPAVLGHEGAGVVVSTGPGVDAVAPGDRVLLVWAPPCRTCWHCTHGEPFLCERALAAAGRPYAALADGTPVYPGLGTAAFAEETVVGAGAVVPLPDDLPLDEAALLGCAVLTGVGAVIRTAGVRPGESVVVLGLGGVGLSAVQGARIAGADPIIAVDPAQAKEPLARALGATHVLTPDQEVAKAIRGLTGGRGADHAIECVGRADTIRLAWSCTRRGGVATVVGIGGRDEVVSFNALELFHFGRTLRGCVFGSTDPARDVPLLLDHVAAGRLDLRGLVTDRIGLDDVEDAFARMGAGHGARSLVVLG